MDDGALLPSPGAESSDAFVLVSLEEEGGVVLQSRMALKT